MRQVGDIMQGEFEQRRRSAIDELQGRPMTTILFFNETHDPKAILMMRGAASTMEKHHKVQILDEALEAAVNQSHCYIPARQLPHKSVSLLDTASARVAVSLHATPAEVDDSRKLNARIIY